jgi:1-acyl-sn-glycerol-3-phosphate acyltransferase
VKIVVKTGLYSYHKRVKVFGVEHIPKDKPVLFLANHQSALMDVLLIATDCGRKPYFITRADVFSNSFLNRVFAYFRMLPIYRIRDGRKTLSKNDLIFNRCAELMRNGNAMVIFPEANHNLKRRVRPLSKGFARIILRSFKRYPDLDIQLVPVGFNYKNAVHFPDEVAVYYGKPISAKSLYDPNNINESSLAIKNEILSRLKKLTTHIPEQMDYNAVLNWIESNNVDLLYPNLTNDRIKFFTNEKIAGTENRLKEKENNRLFISLFTVLNFPVVILWWLLIKPRVPEKEFMGTFRFGAGLIFFPIYALLVFISITFFVNFSIALLSVISLLLLNILLVKFGLR